MKNLLNRLSSSLFFGLLVTVISLGGYYSCSTDDVGPRLSDGPTNKKDLKIIISNDSGSLGEKGGPCFPDKTCNNNLICSTSNICTEKLDLGVVINEDGTKPMGSLGGPCYPNNSCNNGLSCNNGFCAILTDSGQFVDAVST